MIGNAILSISVLLQLTAALLSLRLIKETDKRFPWALLAIALALMASRQIISLTDILVGEKAAPVNLAAEIVALAISVLMISAVLAVKPVLRAVRLSAIQKQEEKNRAAEEARQKDIVLDSVFQSIPDLFFLMDLNGTILEYRFGQDSDLYVRPESFLGKRMRDVLPESVARQFDENLSIAKERGELVTFEYALEVSQELRHWEARISQLPDRRELIAIIRDITERKQMEEKLRSTQLAVDHNADPTFWIRADGKIRYVNLAACRLLEYSQEELQSMTVSDIDPDFPLAAWPEHWREMKDAGAMTFEAHHKTKSGRVFAVEIHTSYILQQNEEYIWAYARDITERKQAQQALLAKEQEQREILDFMLDAVITFDETGKIISFNKTAERLFGYSFAEVAGENINRLMPGPYAGEHDGYLQYYLETGDAQIIGYGREVEGLRKNKETFPMHLSVAELPTDETGKRRFIGTCQELTLIKQQEEQLRRSQKMDALGKLTGGIAHDFNNILGVMTGYAELLGNILSGQPKLADYAHEIHHAGERGARLTKKLLSFSRLEAPEAAKLDINELLQEQQDMLQKSLTVSIKLLIDPGDDIWPVWVDNSDLVDAIFNMSLNAMYAMNDMEVGAQLTIRTANQSLDTLDALLLGLKAGEYVRLSLADTGVGMDATAREKIFDPFFSTKGEKGTGLGLSQVFGFIKRAGGAIKVYSEPGHGSKFVLYFPRYLDDDVDEAEEASEDVIDLRGKENILIVDDETALLKFTFELLSRQGYRVFRAEDAKQALQILEREHVDLMLSDVIMPGMNGYQLAAKVQEKYPFIKIQLASGFANPWKTGMFDESLRQNLLDKPYNSQSLLKNIRALLDNKGVTAL